MKVGYEDDDDYDDAADGGRVGGDGEDKIWCCYIMCWLCSLYSLTFYLTKKKLEWSVTFGAWDRGERRRRKVGTTSSNHPSFISKSKLSPFVSPYFRTQLLP